MICHGSAALGDADAENLPEGFPLWRLPALRRDCQVFLAYPFMAAALSGPVLRVAVAHVEGCYFIDEQKLDQLQRDDRVVLRYIENPNGSLRDICNEQRNVMGLMPHSKRASLVLMGSTDGRVILDRMVPLSRPVMGDLTPFELDKVR